MGTGRALLIASGVALGIFVLVAVIGLLISGKETGGGRTTGRITRNQIDETAMAAIRDAGHPCDDVVSSTRLSDGSIRALCSNGEVYRVARLFGELTAMKCSTAVRLGITGC
jgi:hypothetical protein